MCFTHFRLIFLDKNICKCNLDCRTDGHYHCPQCERTIIRRDAMTSHLLLCQGASAPVSSAALPSTHAVLPTSAVNQRIKITTHIQLPHSPAYRTLTTMCDHCGFVLLRKNLKQHLLRKHPEIATPFGGSTIRSCVCGTTTRHHETCWRDQAETETDRHLHHMWASGDHEEHASTHEQKTPWFLVDACFANRGILAWSQICLCFCLLSLRSKTIWPRKRV